MAKTNVVDGNNAVIMDSTQNAIAGGDTSKTASDVPQPNLTADEVAIQVADIVNGPARRFRMVKGCVATAESSEFTALMALGEAWDKAWLTFKANGLQKTKDFYPYCADSIGVSVKSIEVYMRVLKKRDVLGNAKSIRQALEMIRSKDFTGTDSDADGNGNAGRPARLTDEARLTKILAEIGKLDDLSKCEADLLAGIEKLKGSK